MKINGQDTTRLKLWFSNETKMRRITNTDLSKQLNISRSTIYRLITEYGKDALDYLPLKAVDTLVTIYEKERDDADATFK